MSLDTAQKILTAAGAKKDENAYHFPWTKKLVEVKGLDGETLEETKERTSVELKKISGK